MKQLLVLACLAYGAVSPAFGQTVKASFKSISIGDTYQTVSKSPLVECGISYKTPLMLAKPEHHAVPAIRKINKDFHAAYLKTMADKVCVLRGKETIVGQKVIQSELIFFGDRLKKITVIGDFKEGYKSDTAKERNRHIAVLIAALTEKYKEPATRQYIKAEHNRGHHRLRTVTTGYTWKVGNATVLLEYTKHGKEVGLF